MDLKNQHLNKLKEVFLEEPVKYKGENLTESRVSIGRIPAVLTTPHININWASSSRNTVFTGVGDIKLNNYDVSFIIRSSQPAQTITDSNLKYLTDSLNEFVTVFLDYLLDNYRYANPWFKINQEGQSELLRLDHNNFMITINLQTINY